MSDFADYLHKQELTRRWMVERENASARLDLARIMERLAELKSQHDPIASLIEKPMSDRDRIYAAAFYVAVGRMPQ